MDFVNFGAMFFGKLDLFLSSFGYLVVYFGYSKAFSGGIV